MVVCICYIDNSSGAVTFIKLAMTSSQYAKKRWVHRFCKNGRTETPSDQPCSTKMKMGDIAVAAARRCGGRSTKRLRRRTNSVSDQQIKCNGHAAELRQQVKERRAFRLTSSGVR